MDHTVRVVAHQWYWEYDSRHGDNRNDSALQQNPKRFYTLEATARLDIPLKKLSILYVTRADVLHCFTIPALGIKVDAVPGRTNRLSFSAQLPGKYFGQCREICGANHSFIPIQCLVN